MDRRNFMRLSAIGVLPFLTGACRWEGLWPHNFPVEVHSDRESGHRIRESLSWPFGESLQTKTLVVGAGIAGLSAAWQLRQEDFLLVELSDRIGGTSSATKIEGEWACQGAHYDLAYPANYGPEVLAMLESLQVVRHNAFTGMWDFEDSQYLIAPSRERHCLFFGSLQEDVLPAGPEKSAFLDLLKPYEHRVPFPTRLIEPALRELNELSFLDYLEQRLSLSDSFIKGLDYHMLDDWGGTTAQVSALAGISYFKCRPYYHREVPLFSPPQGNYYFAEKLYQQLPATQVLQEHACRRLSQTTQGWVAEVIDLKTQTVKRVEAEQVIYAGQKHTLPYVLPGAAGAFQANQYAPWVVVNLLVDKEIAQSGYWQNEMLTGNRDFLGFIDSWTQWPHDKQHRVLTAYYCLPPESRSDLISMEAAARPLVDDTLNQLNKWFGFSVAPHVRSAHVNLMGHAMAIPGPGFLFREVNAAWLPKGLQFAGVDSGHLPVFYEAADSGLQAARQLQRRDSSTS